MIRRLLWAGMVMSFIVFLPALWFCVAGFAVLPFSPWSMPGKLAFLGASALLPIACLLGPVLAWKRHDKGQHGWALVCAAAPLALMLAWSIVYWGWMM